MVRQPPSDWPELLVHLEHADPVDLGTLVSALGALGNEYERHIRRTLPFMSPEDARLLVSDVRKGSTIIELIPGLAWAAPFVPSIEKLKATLEFVRSLREALSPYFKAGARNPDLSNATVRNLLDMVLVAAKDTSGSVKIAVKTRADGTLEEFGFRREEAVVAAENLTAERIERERRDTATYPGKLLVFRQTRAEGASPGKPTGDRGVIETLDSRELKVIYVSEMAGEQIKAEIARADRNPYHRAFIVDVNVETVGGRPAAYRIMALHEVIDLD